MRAKITAFLISLALLVTAGVATAPPADAATGTASAVFDLTNAQRTKAGLKPLISDAALDKAAQAWAQQLAKTCTFTHSTSAWRSSRTSSAGWAATGENIAAGYTTAASVVAGWMASAGHKKNILDTRYTGVGIGYAKGTCYSAYWVQIFGWSKTAAAPGAGDANGDFHADVVALKSDGTVIVKRGDGKGRLSAASTVGATGWNAGEKLVTLGDFSGDGVSDIGRIRADGVFALYRGTGSGTYSAATNIGSGWQGMKRVIGGLDFDGDRRTDVLAVNAAGQLMLYRGNGKGAFAGSPRKIGSNWASMTAVLYAGDFNGDRHGDLLARRADGSLWLYPTNGSGSFGTARKVGTGWQGMTAIVGAGDLDGSGTPDVVARRSDGSLVLYRGNGKGGWGTVSSLGTGWGKFPAIG
jgi:uncharacterized protein YkwD